MSNERPYDVVAFGATGFTGRLVAAYLAAHAPPTCRWAIAGRSADKLEATHTKLGLGTEVGVLTADSAAPSSLTAMAAQTHVVLSTVGPFAKYGEPLVAACVKAGTDYVDITGEPEFVNRLIEHYNEPAKEKGLRLVSCCGFDSIPHDLGAYMMVRELPGDEKVTLEGFVSASGKISGGTWQSAIEAMGRVRRQMRPPREPVMGKGRSVRGLRRGPHYEKEVHGWVAPMPTIDPQIVLRSARALPIYGRQFRYGHYLRIGSLPRLIALGAGMGTLLGLAQLPPTRKMLLRYRQSGEGPTPEERQRSSFQVTFVARAGEQRLVGEVRGGDPGYGETSKMVAESALCLAFDRQSLPEQAGVLTPAVAMGDALLERLRGAGLSFEVTQR